MTMQKLVNNGLPQGVSFKKLQPGTVVVIKWNDVPPENALVVEAFDLDRPVNWKGCAQYKVLTKFGDDHHIDATQITEVKENILLSVLC